MSMTKVLDNEMKVKKRVETGKCKGQTLFVMLQFSWLCWSWLCHRRWRNLRFTNVWQSPTRLSISYSLRKLFMEIPNLLIARRTACDASAWFVGRKHRNHGVEKQDVGAANISAEWEWRTRHQYVRKVSLREQRGGTGSHLLCNTTQPRKHTALAPPTSNKQY
jgi:hypothetical protein